MTLERNMVQFLAVRWCDPCQKLAYPSRKVARKVSNSYTNHKSPYPCPVFDSLWHVGRLPDAVREGSMDRWEYYNGREQLSG